MKLIIKALLILLPLTAIGQNTTYLGVEIGPKFEIYQSTDNGNGLYTEPFLYSPIYGLTLGRELNKIFIGEMGFYINDYGKSYRIKGDFGYGSSNALIAYQIPFRLKARLNIRDRLSIVPTIGYTFAINSDFGSSSAGYSFASSTQLQYNDSTRTEDISNYSLKKIYELIETGIAFEYKIENSFTFYLSANYLIGLNRIIEIDVKYWINDQPEQSATVFSNGDYFSLAFGIRYPISNFWTKMPDVWY